MPSDGLTPETPPDGAGGAAVSAIDAPSTKVERSSAGAPYGGWARFDSDNVIRGWATDRTDRSVRPMVELSIDGQRVAVLKADRLDPKLVELGEGDGRYAFAVVVPERFRDGRSHTFEARVQGIGHRLKSKQQTFEVASDAAVPHIELSSKGYGLAEGRMLGGQYSKSTVLEVWHNNERLDYPVETRWSGPAGSPVFKATFAPEAHKAGPLRIAAPGMIEAGLEAPALPVEVGIHAEHDPEGSMTVRLDGDAGWGGRAAIALHIYAGDGRRPALVEPADFVGGSMHLQLPPSLVSAPLIVRVAIGGREAAGMIAPSRLSPGRRTRNGAFQRWGRHGPAEWAVAEGIGFDRGFYTFPQRIVEAQGPSGDLVHLEAVKDNGGRRVLMSQALASPVTAGDRVEGALLVRTSEPGHVRLSLLGDQGAELGSVSVTTHRPWAWAYVAEPMVLSAGAEAAVAELSIDTTTALEVDVAGARFGGGRFREDAPLPEEGLPEAVNAVENADLHDWPNGIVLKTSSGRTETARGWFTYNRRSPTPVLVTADVEESSGRVSYLFATEKAPDYCRLEIRLDSAVLLHLSEGLLSFDAGSTAPARRLLSAANVGVPEFQLIDRILLLKRSRVASAKGFDLVDETAATVARKLLITRNFHRFELPVVMAAARELPDFEWEEGDAQVAEYYLAFELRRSFALALRDMTFQARAEASKGPEAEPYLALEDRNIAVQASHVRGLSKWLTAEIVTPESAEDATAADAPISRWAWSALVGGSLEIVICVHNATEETLACLNSLIGTTRTPHTVRIIDDGSDAQATGRLKNFIADKPWMSLTVNPQNLGYTTSADQGVRQSEAEWVILLNSDTIVTPGWIEGMFEAVASDPQVALVGPLSNAASFQSVPDLYDDANKFKVNDLPPGWSPARMAALVASESEKTFPEAPLLNGFCTLMRRSVFLEVGGMNRAAFPMGYGEENDLCTRVIKAGYKLAIADHVYVYHAKSASFGAARRSELAKVGGKTLKELHPDVDYGLLTSRFRDLPALVRLRSVLRECLGKLV